MSFKLGAGRIGALLALARAEDGLPLAAHPADMPMLATLGLAAVKPLDDGARAWRLTLAGRRAADALKPTACAARSGPESGYTGR